MSTGADYSKFLNGHSHEDGLVKLALEDVQKSGLTPETLEKARVRLFRGGRDDLRERLGFSSINGQDILKLCRLIEIPYLNERGEISFYRYKIVPSTKDEHGKDVKYLNPTGKPAIPYIPPEVYQVRDKTNKPLWVTEGEKKGLKLLRHGRFCISLSGVWNFKAGKNSYLEDDKSLWQELQSFEWQGRTVYLGFDQDLWVNPSVRAALYEVACKLYERGGIIKIAKWDDKLKGIDDFLAAQANPEEALQVIENTATGLTDFFNPDHRYEIIRAIGFVKNKIEKELLTKAAAKAIGVSVETLRDKTSEEEEEPVICANFPGLVDLVTVPDKDLPDVKVVAFLIKDGDNLRVETDWIGLIPPAKIDLPFILPRAKDVVASFSWPPENDRELFEDVLRYLKRFSYLEDRCWLIVACKVFLTYLQDHPDIHYLPMILFYAVPERGKSRTGKAVTYISYRGVHVVDLREANLFRYSENHRATIFFDLMDLWKKAEKNGAGDILLLRYEKGAKASRVIYPEKGPFKDMKHYDTYGPTIIATNEPLHKILDSRCIAIPMPNRPGDYENPTPDKAQELRERLTAWRARVMDKPLPEVEIIEGINGRLWDIAKPLLQVCKMVYPNGFDDLKAALLEIAGQRIEDKKDSIEGQIIYILHELSPKGIFEWVIKTSDVLDKLNTSRPADRKLSSQYIGKRLKAMGIQTRKVHGYSEIILTLSAFNTLLTQHGFDEVPPPVPGNSLLNSTAPPHQGKLRVCEVESQVESAENSTQLSTHEDRINTERGSLVESGREFSGDDEAINMEITL